MNITYLITSLISFVAWMILKNMDSQVKWIALGIGAILLLFGIFRKGSGENYPEVEVEVEVGGEE